MSGHVDSDRINYDRVHGGYGFGEKNEAGKRILDFPSAYEIVIVNTYFRKREDYYKSSKSGGNKSQIKYFMCKKVDLK